MPDIFLHDRPDFPELIRIVSDEMGIDPSLVEKDYWIMHVLYGLKMQGFSFELKGGTSLSKGFGIIHRFSEDIDIHIHPPADRDVQSDPNKRKPGDIESRRSYYDWLAGALQIHGIRKVARDHEFDDEDAYRSGGIRLLYDSVTEQQQGVKEGILLEAGFDNVTPNSVVVISSWALEKALTSGVPGLMDNRAQGIMCYHPGYTLVEKLQTIATKFRREMEGATKQPNYMRQYYDVHCLLDHPDVQAFIGTGEYLAHKERRFPQKDKEVPLSENEAFMLSKEALRADFITRYQGTRTLYYKGQPPFEDVLARIQADLDGFHDSESRPFP